MIRVVRGLLASAAAAAILSAPISAAAAQSGVAAGDSGRARASLPGANGRRAGQAAGGAANRDALERQVRQALARVTRQRLGLDDAQMSQLTDLDRKFQPRRQALTRDETETRKALRAAMADTAKPDQQRIGADLDHLMALQRQRLDLQQEEQKALAGFLTPLQRAQYQALQERMRRRLDAMRQQGGGAGGRRGAGGARQPRRPPPL